MASRGPAPGLEWVFAYGSNGVEQVKARVGRAVSPCLPARLLGYTRIFALHSSRWGGAIASIFPSPGTSVAGMLFQLTPGELKALDAFEGGYLREMLGVTVAELSSSPSLSPASAASTAQPPPPPGSLVRAHAYLLDPCDTERLAFRAFPSVAYLVAIDKMLSDSGLPRPEGGALLVRGVVPGERSGSEALSTTAAGRQRRGGRRGGRQDRIAPTAIQGLQQPEAVDVTLASEGAAAIRIFGSWAPGQAAVTVFEVPDDFAGESMLSD